MTRLRALGAMEQELGLKLETRLNSSIVRKNFEAFRKRAVKRFGDTAYNRALAWELLGRGTHPNFPQLISLHAQPEHLPLLRLAMQHENADVRWSAALALGRVGKPATSSAMSALTSRDPTLRKAAQLALGQIGRPAVKEVAKALRHERPSVREAAANALGNMPPKDVLPYIPDLVKHALQFSDPYVRMAASDALSKLGEPAALEVDKHALRHKDPFVRIIAARTLGRIGAPLPRDVQSRLEYLAGDTDELTRVRTVAREAIQRLQGKTR